MATYKGIKGVKVQSKATDPTASEAEGTVWYNTATTALKYSIAGTGAWASAPAMNTTRAQFGASGLQGAAMAAGGSPPSGGSANTEKYDGSTWTEVNNLTTSRWGSTGGGTSTAALCVSGYTTTYTANCETYDGTSWSEEFNVITARNQAGGCGVVQTAALFFGGEGSPFPLQKNKTELWNGTCWTAVNNLITGRTQICGMGTSTAALGAAGHPGSGTTGDVESWDGTCWSEINNLNTPAEGRMGMGANNTTGIVAGGRVSPTYYANTESYDGTSWTEVSDLGSGRYNGSAVGTASLGILAGGTNPGTGGSTTTELWNDPTYTIKTVTVS